MNADLDKLRNELQPLLEQRGFVVFHGASRMNEEDGIVFWDSDRHPDYHEFLECAEKLSVKVIVVHTREFEKESIDDVQAEIEDSTLPPAERRELERRLKALKPYTGFTSNVELSFDYAGGTYMYELRSESMTELLNIMSELDSGYYTGEDTDDDDEPNPPGGFYSRN